ncbi:MAG: hypothetical protein K1V71_03775 [Paramuribaculum sp.]
MMASIYSPSRENAAVHIGRVSSIIPPDGKVCIMQLTDKQFSEIKIYEGRKKAKPETCSVQLELF